MIYLTGDIHGDIHSLLVFIKDYNLSDTDTVILLGDVGLNYFGNASGDGEKKRQLNNSGVTILCIHGNHEKRPQTICSYKEQLWNGGIVYEEPAYSNLKFAKDGEVYNLDGKNAIAIGGAYSVDKYYRLLYGLKWFNDEQPSNEIKATVESKLEEMNWTVDLVLSHTCPEKYIPTEAFLPGLSQDGIDRSTEEWLDRIENRLNYQAWYCGHWHINKRIDKIHFLMESKECL